jgi:hypothetical protein
MEIRHGIWSMSLCGQCKAVSPTPTPASILITYSRIETSVGILCTSIPVIKPLLLRVAPRLLLSTGEHSHYPGNDTYPRDVSHARRNSFALHAIKVTHELHQTEDDIADSNSIRAYGLQEPNVTLGFENYEKRTVSDGSGQNSSDEHLVVPPGSRSSSMKEGVSPDDKKRPTSYQYEPPPTL